MHVRLCCSRFLDSSRRILRLVLIMGLLSGTGKIGKIDKIGKNMYFGVGAVVAMSDQSRTEVGLLGILL